MVRAYDHKFLEAVQARLARVAIGPSATRNQGRGVVSKARAYLSQLDLSEFGTRSEKQFLERLDRATIDLQEALPRKSKRWGLARKLLNIFLRDALYTVYLCNRYDLARAERYYEVPMDSISSASLRKCAGRRRLPQWRGVKHFTPEANESYQKFAATLAKHVGISRVHLDTFWWGLRANDDDDKLMWRCAELVIRENPGAKHTQKKKRSTS